MSKAPRRSWLEKSSGGGSTGRGEEEHHTVLANAQVRWGAEPEIPGRGGGSSCSLEERGPRDQVGPGQEAEAGQGFR